MTQVDVIIPTYNRVASLRRCLNGLAAQTCRDFTVTVIDDCGTLDAAAAVDSAIASAMDVRVMRTPANGGPARARNAGVRATSSPLLAFVDDDVVPDSKWLEQHLAARKELGPGDVQIGPLSAPRDWRPTPWNRWEARTLEIEYRRMQAGLYTPTWRQLFTGNAMMPRESFERAGGFDERFTRAEDIELGLRLERGGSGFAFIPGAVGWHYAERSKASWLAIPRAYALFDVMLDRMYPDLRWADRLAMERRYRNPISRAAAAPLRLTGLDRTGARTAIGAAQLLHSAGLVRPAMALLSFSYALEYQRSLDEALERTGQGSDPAGVVPPGSAEGHA